MLNAWFRRIGVVLLSLLGAPVFAADALIVFAAASLTDSLQKASDEYTRSSGTPLKLSFASSSALAKQIENGAGADVFFSADQEWMDYLVSKQLIRTESRLDVLGNRLVLIAPADSKVTIKLGPQAALAAALGRQGRLATGEPNAVPAGKYARAALTSLGLWSDLEPRLARAENVRVALSYVARGEAPLGIVYLTDAIVEPKVRIVDTFPESSHGPISYPVALTKTAKDAASGYLKFLQGGAAAALFSKAGFTMLTARSGGRMISGCSGFAFDLSREIELLGGKATAVTAGTSVRKAAALQPGKSYRITLADQSKVSFAAKPGKEQTEVSPQAGLLRLTPSGKTLRVTLADAAWIDVVSGAEVITSTRHTGSRDCPGVRKSVEFAVTAGTPVTLQLSNSAQKSVGVVVSGS